MILEPIIKKFLYYCNIYYIVMDVSASWMHNFYSILAIAELIEQKFIQSNKFLICTLPKAYHNNVIIIWNDPKIIIIN